MRKTVTLFAFAVFASGIASAQYKKQVQTGQQKAPAQQQPMQASQAAQVEAALAKVRRISEQDSYRLLTNGSAVIVDVRSNSQYQLGHIKGSVSIPRSQIVSRFKEIPPGKTVITYCACSAEQTSGLAVIELANHGVKNAAAMKGGWHAWQAAGFPTAKGPQ
ncbi:MAG TPA: rhodanese-like domain-containing protein [Thermoanaerobaculia bacterium]|nr:rhodanese-like domain-containing protein [Thermoanaerobaculia bacterium]